MAEYLIYKVERFRSGGGDHTANQVKYLCEIPPTILHDGEKETRVARHPLTDDNLYRLVGQIAQIYEPNDTIETLAGATITGDAQEITLTEPLHPDEMRLLAVEVLERLVQRQLSHPSQPI
jgi:hypothetical protein